MIDAQRTVSLFVMTALLTSMIAGQGSGYGNALSCPELPNWLYPTFEENVNLSWCPARVNHTDTVNLTIKTIGTQQFGGAYLYYNITPAGASSPQPGGPFGATFVFDDATHTVMHTFIPSYVNRGGNKIEFYVVAWDLDNFQLRSRDHNYTVLKNGSLEGTFESNFNLSFTPTNPYPLQSVVVGLKILRPELQLRYTSLKFVLKIPAAPQQSGSLNFVRQSSEFWNVTIPGMPGNSSVMFQVLVEDIYGTRLSSPNYEYRVRPADPRYNLTLVLVVKDLTRNRFVESAHATIRNASWSYTGLVINGMFWCPVPLSRGKYTVEVEYENEKQRIELEIPNPRNNYTLWFFFGVLPVLEPFPQWYVYIGILLGLFVLPSVTIILYRQRAREQLELVRMRTYRAIAKVQPTLSTKLWNELKKEFAQPRYFILGSFFLLAFFGTLFIPFYPWWIALMLAVLIAVIAFRYRLTALIALSLFVTAAASYQSPEFGLSMLLFSLFVLLCSFFDWRFGVLVFFMLFMSRLGLTLVVPVLAALLFPLFLVLTATVIAGLFLIFVVSASNYNILGFIVSAPHSLIITNFGSAPVKFTPSLVGEAFARLGEARLHTLISCMDTNFGISILPFLQLGTWCIIVYFCAQLVERKQAVSYNLTSLQCLKLPVRSRNANYVLGAITLTVFATFLPIVWFGYFSAMIPESQFGTTLIIIGLAAVIYTTITAGLILRQIFNEYYISRLATGTVVGTRISDMPLSRTTFEQVGGLEDLKLDLKESVLVPLLRPDISEQFGVEPAKGILLFGPPGCGKTLTMKALATELNIEMINVKCGDVMSKWYGESETRMMELFKTAKERRPCILFFDEIDAIAKRRDLYSADDVTPRLLSIMLSELDGMDRSAGLIIVGSTNKPELIDPALLRPGRFDKIIYVPPPDFAERAAIFRVHLVGKPLAGGIDVKELVKRTEGFSGADIANLVKEAATAAMRRAIATGQPSLITMQDFLSVLPRIKPSITLTMKEEFEKVKIQYERRIHELARTEAAPRITLRDVGNLSIMKEALKQNVAVPLTRSELVERFRLIPMKALMLYGPGGCGKTLIIKALANEFNITLHIVTGAELFNSIVAKGENAIKELITVARDTAPSIILVSDIDQIASVELKAPENRVALSLFLVLVDRIQPSEKVMLVVTTDRPETLDASLFAPNRFSKVIYVPPPDLNARKEIFELALRYLPLVGEIKTSELAEKTAGYSGEDIMRVVEMAKLQVVAKEVALEESGRRERYGLTHAHILDALARTKPSISQDMLSSYQRFMKTYENLQ